MSIATILHKGDEYIVVAGRKINLREAKEDFEIQSGLMNPKRHSRQQHIFSLIDQCSEYNELVKVSILYSWRFLRIMVLEKDPRVKISWNQIKDSTMLEEWGKQFICGNMEEFDKEKKEFVESLKVFSRCYFSLLCKVRELASSEPEDRAIWKVIYSYSKQLCTSAIGLQPFNGIIDKELTRLYHDDFNGAKIISKKEYSTIAHAALEEASFTNTTDGTSPESIEGDGLLTSMVINGEKRFLIPPQLNPIIQEHGNSFLSVTNGLEVKREIKSRGDNSRGTRKKPSVWLGAHAISPLAAVHFPQII